MRGKHLKYFGIFMSATELSKSTEIYLHICICLWAYSYIWEERKKNQGGKIATFEDSGWRDNRFFTLFYESEMIWKWKAFKRNVCLSNLQPAGHAKRRITMNEARDKRHKPSENIMRFICGMLFCFFGLFYFWFFFSKFDRVVLEADLSRWCHVEMSEVWTVL